MSRNQIFALIAALAVVAWLAVLVLKHWSSQPEKWQSKIPPQPPDLQTEEMKPAEMPVKPPPILPPEKVVQARPEQPKRK